MGSHKAAAADTAVKKTDIAAEKWKKRLSGLPEEVQKKISKKYYSGSMPWKTEAKNER